MAMEKTVVASPQAMEGIRAITGQELLIAADANEYVDRIIPLLKADQRTADIGRAARLRVLSDYSWASSLSRLDAMILSPHARQDGGVRTAGYARPTDADIGIAK
jgi:hypothetical protein